MADKRISQLVDRGTIANNDVVPIVVSGAVTTNKATISSIQTFMQGNLDFGVTSVGITIGTSGNDVNVSGSPVTTSGNITINIPDASTTARGLINTIPQTFNGSKTFSLNLNVAGLSVGRGASNGNEFNGIAGNTALGQQALFSITTGFPNTALGSEALRNITTGSNNIAIGKEAGKLDVIAGAANATSNSSIYIGNNSKPNANGGTNEIVIGHNGAGSGSNTVTIGNSSTTSNKFFGRVIHADAVNADESATLGQVNTSLGGYVTLATAQTITAQKVFNTSGSSDSVIITHGSGSGIALDVIKAGNSEAIRVTKTSGSGNAMSVIGGNSNFDGGITTTSAVLTSVLQGLNANFTGLVETSDSVRIGTTASIKHNSAVYTLNGFNNIQGNINSFVVTNESKNLRLNFPSVGGLTHTLPDTSGTLALTTDLGAYLPLTGGTLTGNLSLSAGNLQIGAGNGLILNNPANTQYFQVYTSASNELNFGYGGTTPIVAKLGATGALTLTGALNGTSAVFTQADAVPLTVVRTTENSNVGIRYQNNTTSWYAGQSSDGAFAISFNAADLSSGQFKIASTGAATFSSSVTAKDFFQLNADSSNVSLIRTNTSNSVLVLTANQSLVDSVPRIEIVGTSFAGASDTIFYRGATQIFTSSSASTERMRLTSGGFLKSSNTGSYIGVSNSWHEFNNNIGGTVVLYLRSHGGTNGSGILVTTPAADTSEYFFGGNSDGVARVRIYTNGNIQNQNNSYGSLSDIKLKENIEDATPKLDDLMKVKVRNYNLIGDDKKQIGVIAQELEEVFPAMIDESEDFEDVEVPQVDEEGNEILNEEGEVQTTKERVSKGTSTKSVKYSVFVPMLIKAIQELKTEIDSLKNQIK